MEMRQRFNVYQLIGVGYFLRRDEAAAEGVFVAVFTSLLRVERRVAAPATADSANDVSDSFFVVERVSAPPPYQFATTSKKQSASDEAGTGL